jgi:dihydrodipicolinate synthase/N-acetylneuraminate lyase
MATLDLSGTGVALVTPFKKSAIDFETLSSLIGKVIDGGGLYRQSWYNRETTSL